MGVHQFTKEISCHRTITSFDLAATPALFKRVRSYDPMEKIIATAAFNAIVRRRSARRWLSNFDPPPRPLSLVEGS